MKNGIFFTAAAIVALFAISAPTAFGQDDASVAENKYKEGISALRSNDLSGASEALKASLAAGEKVADSAVAVAATRYALAYALSKQGKHVEAIPVLDALVGTNPDHTNARFLLGVSLLLSFNQSNAQRGVEVLQQLAQESEGTAKTAASQTAARLGYNVSTVDYAAGDTSSAQKLLSALGSDAGADDQENMHIGFANGVYQNAGGNSRAATSALEAVISGNDGYALANGVTAKKVLANVYYQSILSALDGGKEQADAALALVDKLTALEGEASLDVLHAKALALTAKGDAAGAKAEMDAIKAKDPAYHAKISPPPSA